MVFGLPLHPLLVHFPVVFVPLAALSVVILAFSRRRSRPLAGLALGLVVVAFASTVAAYLAGNEFAKMAGVPREHERWGVALLVGCLVFVAVAGSWLWLLRKDGDKPRPALRPWGWAASALAVIVTVLTVLAGHSGAVAVWAQPELDGRDSTPTSTVSAPQSNESALTATAADGYTMEEIAQHNTAESCWAAIDGNAYDLTSWIQQHPGGADAIKGLCGTDATAAFQGKHGEDQRPAQALERFLLGPVS